MRASVVGKKGGVGMIQSLYYFCIAAIRIHHKFSGLKQREFTIL